MKNNPFQTINRPKVSFIKLKKLRMSFFKKKQDNFIYINVMSFKGIFDIILHLQSFQNIDIPNQGMFAIRACIFSSSTSQSPKHTNYSVPFEPKAQGQNFMSNYKKIIEPAKCEDQYFWSKVMILKFYDEKIILNDVVRFRLQVESFPNLQTDNVVLQFDLFFQSHYTSSYVIQKGTFEGQIMDTKKFQLHHLEKGIISFCSAEFQKGYSSKFCFSVFGCLESFSFGKYLCEGQQKLKSKDLERTKLQNFEQFVEWCAKHYGNKIGNAHQYIYQTYVKYLRYYFYLIQEKASKVLFRPITPVLKIPSEYLPNSDQEINEKIFRQYMTQYKPTQLTSASILKEINQIRGDIFFFVMDMEKQMASGGFRERKMKEQYDQYVKDRFGQRVFKTVVYGNNSQLSSKENKNISKKMRDKELITSGEQYPIDDIANFGESQDKMQFIFYEATYPSPFHKHKNAIRLSHSLSQDKKEQQDQEQEQMNPNTRSNEEEKEDKNGQGDDRYELQPQKSQSEDEGKDLPAFTEYCEKNMLIVMCHGFQGTSFDMMLVYRNMKEKFPDASYIISRANEGQTEGNIESLGQNLANEIKNYIRHYMDNEQVIINFIGHSMGGIVARASLKFLSIFHQRMGFYWSLGSPHLGYLNGVGGMVKAGLWFFTSLKPVKSLSQLSMEDSKNPRETFLYELSWEGRLRFFHKIILWSSFEDSYVAWHSARISPHHSKNNSSSGKVEQQMVNNILGDRPVHRVDINFNVKGKKIDNFIGRTAHINLIAQESIFKIINITIPQLFDISSP